VAVPQGVEVQVLSHPPGLNIMNEFLQSPSADSEISEGDPYKDFIELYEEVRKDLADYDPKIIMIAVAECLGLPIEYRKYQNLPFTTLVRLSDNQTLHAHPLKGLIRTTVVRA
jgi:hypothetical protein